MARNQPEWQGIIENWQETARIERNQPESPESSREQLDLRISQIDQAKLYVGPSNNPYQNFAFLVRRGGDHSRPPKIMRFVKHKYDLKSARMARNQLELQGIS